MTLLTDDVLKQAAALANMTQRALSAEAAFDRCDELLTETADELHKARQTANKLHAELGTLTDTTSREQPYPNGRISNE
jgi:hypothetical protein